MKRADTTLIYGETGTGKTTQLGELAKWYYELTGKIARLISADSSWDPIEQWVITKENPQAFIEAWNIQFLALDPGGKNDPFGILVKLSEGCWPKARDGKLVLEAPAPGPLKRTDGREIGLILVEGTATIAEMLLQDHIRRQRKIAQDIVGDFTSRVEVERNGKLSTEDIKFGKAGQAHFGQVQDFMLLDLIPRFGAMPVDMVVWTGHESRGTDDISKIKGSALGPATVGTAAVSKTAKKFGDTFHLMNEFDKEKRTVEYRAYYRDHPDAVLSNMIWPCKISFPLHRSEELSKTFPGGFVPLTPKKGGLEKFWDLKYKDVLGHMRKKPDVAKG